MLTYNVRAIRQTVLLFAHIDKTNKKQKSKEEEEEEEEKEEEEGKKKKKKKKKKRKERRKKERKKEMWPSQCLPVYSLLVFARDIQSRLGNKEVQRKNKGFSSLLMTLFHRFVKPSQVNCEWIYHG